MKSRMSSRIIELSLFIVIVAASDNKYCQFSCNGSAHTVCNREKEKCDAGPLCGSEFKYIELTDDDRQFILDLHNNLRNEIASGQHLSPPAANMNALSYNKELEFIAHCWANACNGKPLKHDVCRRTAEYNYVGQNLGWWSSTSSDFDLRSGIKKSIMNWFNEVANFDPAVTNSFASGKKTIGHYTQLVWADTLEIGCGVSFYIKQREGRRWYDKILACNYGPGGNYLGQPVYKIGKPASKCSKRKPNKKYTALCGKDIPLNQTLRFKDEFFNVSI
nr:venom allergen 5-like [Leptinotarsa decemlineata]